MSAGVPRPRLRCALADPGPGPEPGESHARWRVNPRIHLQTTSVVPPEVEHRVPFHQAFDEDLPVAWVEDPVRRMIVPHVVDEVMTRWIERLRAGSVEPGVLPREVRDALVASSVLVPEEGGDRSGDEGGAVASLRARGYAVIRELVSPPLREALRRYARALDAAAAFELDRQQVRGRRKITGDLAATWLHYQLVERVSALAGRTVLPSYTYLAIYPPGSVLARHVDRPQCELSLSLSVDSAPDEAPEHRWPLSLEVAGEPVHLSLAVGDALVYRGRDLPHWREALPDPYRKTVLLLHYVWTDFAGGFD